MQQLDSSGSRAIGYSKGGQSITSAFWSLSKFICPLVQLTEFFFGSSYLCEEAFFQVKIIQLIL